MRGSTPLARGTLQYSCHRIRRLRFNPARAGNSSASGLKDSIEKVQPRSRGELPLKFYSEKIVNGSTPLARGTRPDARLQRPEYRFNPARAGNSGQSRSHARQRTVQPRSRGELRIKSSIAQISNGSTPLARGTPVLLA